MDLSVLPELCGLGTFVCCFRPLVRRAGPHTNIWFAGWIFLLLHYVAVMLPSGDTFRGEARDLAAIWAMELCGFCFLLAASNAPVTRQSRILSIELGIPIVLQSLLYIVDIHSVALHLLALLLLTTPAIHLLLVPSDRTPQFNRLATAFALLGVGLAPFSKVDGFIILEVILCALFLSAAYLTLTYAARTTRGVVALTVGLVLWALSFLLQATSRLPRTIALNHALLDLPRYIAAAGMILTLLDEYTKRADSLALHDPLTGLPNRRHFDTRLEEAMIECEYTGVPVACLVIDVDKFKYINDTFGHPVGDGLLQALARRLSWNLGPRDMLARTGGDEFTAILVEAADESHVRFIAGAMMAAGCVPVSIQQHLIDVRLSIGIAVAPRDAVTTADLHRTADEAMYRAKRHGGSGIAFAQEELSQIHAV